MVVAGTLLGLATYNALYESYPGYHEFLEICFKEGGRRELRLLHVVEGFYLAHDLDMEKDHLTITIDGMASAKDCTKRYTESMKSVLQAIGLVQQECGVLVATAISRGSAVLKEEVTLRLASIPALERHITDYLFGKEVGPIDLKTVAWRIAQFYNCNLKVSSLEVKQAEENLKNRQWRVLMAICAGYPRMFHKFCFAILSSPNLNAERLLNEMQPMGDGDLYRELVEKYLCGEVLCLPPDSENGAGLPDWQKHQLELIRAAETGFASIDWDGSLSGIRGAISIPANVLYMWSYHSTVDWSLSGLVKRSFQLARSDHYYGETASQKNGEHLEDIFICWHAALRALKKGAAVPPSKVLPTEQWEMNSYQFPPFKQELSPWKVPLHIDEHKEEALEESHEYKRVRELNPKGEPPGKVIRVTSSPITTTEDIKQRVDFDCGQSQLLEWLKPLGFARFVWQWDHTGSTSSKWGQFINAVE